MLKKIWLLCLFFITIFLPEAQETRPVIRFIPFVSRGISSEETRFIESLIQSYISDAGELIFNYDDIPPDVYQYAGELLGGSWNTNPDYILSGSIYLERKNRIFTMEIRNTHTNEVAKTTTNHRTAGDLVLKARSLVESIFKFPVLPVMGSGAGGAANETERAIPQVITENSIAGTWRGEQGIEMIRLQLGGRGTAFFSSGARMNLSYVIEGNTLKIWQNSPNIERYYYPNPPDTAKLLSAMAEPMRWELMLYSGGSRLRGTKTSAEIRVSQNGNTEPSYETRDALLIRSYY
jgi:hypothetical protein